MWNLDKVWIPESYADDGISFLNLRFENDVKIYGIQTNGPHIETDSAFENDVKIYGIQTKICYSAISEKFENDVKIYGIQTKLSM